jgi:hypothetical protein
MNIAMIDELRELLRVAQHIVNSTASWEIKYDLIFSNGMSRRVHALLPLDYHDPDTTYEEDVRAFVNAFDDKIKELGDL